MPLILAHAGHWFLSLLYVAPVAIIVGVLMVQSRRDKRRAAREARDAPAENASG